METDLSQVIHKVDDYCIQVPEAEISIRSQLLRAALAGDWAGGKIVLHNNPNLLSQPLTPSGETALHVSAVAGGPNHEYFVKKMLGNIEENELEIMNKAGSTALHFAALSGNCKIAYDIVMKNKKLVNVSNHQDARPLLLAAMSGHGKMVEFLLPFSRFDSWDDAHKSQALNSCIASGLYGVAGQILEHHPTLALAKDQNGEAPLIILARNPQAFPSRHKLGWWRRRITTFQEEDAFQLLERIWQQVPKANIGNLSIHEDIANPAFVAAEMGNYEFLVKLLRERPEFLYIVNESSQSIYHIAVKHRHESIFSLIYEIGKLKDLVATYRDGEDNTMLHLAATLSPLSQRNTLPGAALQMHREMLWYKEVEKVVPSGYKNMKNTSGETPYELFIKEHKELAKKGEKWMKGIAESCMIVATLIATVTFVGGVFSMTGGNENDEGRVHSIAEMIGMLSSSTAMITFLGIRTSAFTEKDFLRLLPILLIIGLTTLTVSIAAMLVAFGARLLRDYQQALPRVLILFSLFGFFVQVMFLFLKNQQLANITKSLCGTMSMFRSRNRLFTK